METMKLLAPVGDPVRAEVEDAVIREARRHARRRRLRSGGLGAVVVGLVAAAWVLNALSSVQLTTPTFVDLPPDGAPPSAPAAGELVVEYPTENVRAWLYGDGRLITMRMYGTFNEHGWPNSGFLEQRLTPSGVEMIRSYVAAHVSEPVEETRPANERGRDVRVRVGDKLYRRSGTYGPPYWRCNWGGCEKYITDLNSVLPASAWVNKEYRQYVPTRYRICAYAGRNGHDAPVELVRAALPAEVREVFTPGAAAASGWGCVHVSPDTARTAETSLVAAGFPAEQRTVQQYTFTIPVPDGREYTGSVMIGPVLPNGDAEEPGG